MHLRLAVIVVLPILASTAMALSNGWTPVGDNATLSLRAGDVVRGDPPLVGMPTTADAIGAEPIDHPGPLEVWLAAPAVALAGPTGLLVTIAIVNAAMLVIAVNVGWRRGRAPLGLAVTATALLLCWSLGTTVIRDPLNSHAPLLGWFTLVLLCWDIRLGRWASLPLAVAVASWVVQCHVLYVPVTAILILATAGFYGLDHRRRTPGERRRAGVGRRIALIGAGVVGLVLSTPLLVDQFFGSGNLGRMVAFSARRGLGFDSAARTTIYALGLPAAWLRPINDPFLLLRGPSPADVMAFSATTGLIAWALASASKRRDRSTVALLQTALISLLGTAIAVARTPQRGAVLAADPMLLLRPVTALVWLALGWALWRMVSVRVMPVVTKPRWARAAGALGCVAALAVVSITVFAPAKFGGYGEGLMKPIAGIEPKVVGSVEGQRLVQVNASGWAARLYLRHTLMERLEREGVKTRTGDADRAFRRSGSSLGQPSATLWVVSDPLEPQVPAQGAFLIASSDLVPGGELSEISMRRRRLRTVLDEAGRIQLRSSERISIGDVSREYFRWSTPPEDGRSLPASWVTVDAFVDLARNGLVAAPEVDEALVDQVYADSVGRFFAAEDMRVAVYLRFE